MTAALLSLTLALSLFTGQHAPQQGGSEPLAPELEARVQTLGKQLRCAVCQGVSIADSPASMARAQLDTVRELVAEGKTDQQVLDYFVARYGEWALLEPKAHGFNWLVWLGPVALVALGGFVIWRQFQHRPAPAQPTTQQTAAPAAPAGTSSPDDAEDPYLQAVRRELER
ncbi:cytochrome c-type biogenesis protein CcmH [Pyxidicoccus fallax]|uniref:Cytochrome c-type biogenesis protein n=1 Tax=Pyxidicoccus fallax TaxID=394095 RepID=A0A848LXF4_9BACT|nr:cytochrome c-type biogenesis protein [Pyxidicoccus fallax]NMO22301.1 cytochrome c-type biogenesis protein CcmH [Pyxidicoccus fallax]NPC85848.1 cytochrome c-type biogenesis protein CcmH [Pyxidicoccus fallax]